MYTEFLNKWIDVEIDRPLGSKHPRCELWFNLNYGFVPGTRAGDGEEIDVYVLGETQPIKFCRAFCIAIAFRFDDVEHKLITSFNGDDFDNDIIWKQIEFNEKYFDSKIIRTKDEFLKLAKEKEERSLFSLRNT